MSSEITEAVEQIDDAVVSIINLQRNDFSSWAGFYGMESASEDEYLQAGSGSGAVYKIEDDQAYIFTTIMWLKALMQSSPIARRYSCRC